MSTSTSFTKAHQLANDSGERYLLALANAAEPGAARAQFEALSHSQVLRALVSAAERHGYDQWVSATPAGYGEHPVPAVRTPGSNEVLTAALLEQSLASFFDSMVQARWQAKDLVWFARRVPADESPQAHEWGIGVGLVGVALPVTLSLKLAQQADERLQDSPVQREPAPAP